MKMGRHKKFLEEIKTRLKENGINYGSTEYHSNKVILNIPMKFDNIELLISRYHVCISDNDSVDKYCLRIIEFDEIEQNLNPKNTRYKPLLNRIINTIVEIIKDFD